MHLINRWIKLAVSLVLYLCLSSCSSSISKVTPSDTPSMEDIYFESTRNVEKELEAKRVVLNARKSNLRDYTSTVPAQVQRTAHLFPALPNPILYLYVSPHPVGKTGAPIPGYYTRFTMYERTHFAMPGETLETLPSLHEPEVFGQDEEGKGE